MDIEEDGRILSLKGINVLNKAITVEFQAAVRLAAKSRALAIEVDLSELPTLDSSGLAALVALRKAVDAKPWTDKPAIRRLQPQPAVQQMLELTRMHHLFEIIRNYEELPAAAPSLSPGPPAIQTA